MEKIPENLFQPKEIEEKFGDEDFKTYLADLELAPEDLKKKMLEIGPLNGGFSKYVKEHGLGSEIYNLEPFFKLEDKDSVYAKAEAAPFKDASFDMIISNAAIPNVLLGQDSEKIKQNFFEMFRILKPGGEIRLGRTFGESIYPRQKKLRENVVSILKELEKMGAQIEETRKPKSDVYEYDDNWEPKKLISETILIKIKKSLENK